MRFFTLKSELKWCKWHDISWALISPETQYNFAFSAASLHKKILQESTSFRPQFWIKKESMTITFQKSISTSLDWPWILLCHFYNPPFSTLISYCPTLHSYPYPTNFCYYGFLGVLCWTETLSNQHWNCEFCGTYWNNFFVIVWCWIFLYFHEGV